MKTTIKAVFMLACLMVCSCHKEANTSMSCVKGHETEMTNGIETSLVNLMLEASSAPELVRVIHDEAEASYEVGLEESVYFGEILADTPASKTGSNRALLKEFLLNNKTLMGTKANSLFENIELYWPYHDDWDGVSRPVVVFNRNDESQYIDGDKTVAYRFVSGEIESVETLIVDEEYAMHNPVWVINESHFSLEDILHQKEGNVAESKIVPRVLPETKASGTSVARLMMNTIQSTQQHDSWLAGGSEYMIFWFFPSVFDKTGTVESNRYGEIVFTRKEIKKATTRVVSLIGNDNWLREQKYNKLKVIECDPGKNIKFEVNLKGSYEGFSGEIKSSFDMSNEDDHIMEIVINRDAMLSNDYYVNDKTYTRFFTGSGVTIKTTFQSIGTSYAF